jgi:ferredoxin
MSAAAGTAAVLHIDWTRCDARGSCMELLPELLQADRWGYPLARAGGSNVVIPAHLQEAADDAVGLCPMLALRFRTP